MIFAGPDINLNIDLFKILHFHCTWLAHVTKLIAQYCRSSKELGFFNPRSQLNSTVVTFPSPIIGVRGFFLSVKFATSLTRFARSGMNIFNYSLTIGLRYKKLDYLLFLITQSYYPAGIKNYTIQKKIVLDSEN